MCRVKKSGCKNSGFTFSKINSKNLLSIIQQADNFNMAIASVAIQNAQPLSRLFLSMIEQIIKKIEIKNKNLLADLRPIEIRLENDNVVIRRKDRLTGLLEDLVFRYDSEFRLWYKERNA